MRRGQLLYPSLDSMPLIVAAETMHACITQAGLLSEALFVVSGAAAVDGALRAVLVAEHIVSTPLVFIVFTCLSILVLSCLF